MDLKEEARRKKISEASKRSWSTPERRARPGPNKGRKFGEEVGRKISKAKKGVPNLKRRGAKFSDESKALMREKKLGTAWRAGKWKDPRIADLDDRVDPGVKRGLWLNNLVANKIQKAKGRGKKWEISNYEAALLLISECFYCGFKGEINQMGIDRVNNAEHYTKENVVACCKYCNNAKLDRSANEFYQWARLLYERTSLRPDKQHPSTAN